MSTERKYYFVKLNPPRPTFTMDMSADEREIMQQHVAYWAPYLDEGVMVAMGPVLDPEGAYGAGIISVESEEQLALLLADDPANGLCNYKFHPMPALSIGKTGV